MCGIFGFVGSAETGSRIDLEAALRAMKHRGPDGRGIFRDDSRASRAGGWVCLFANTRLAILDLSEAASLPMSTADGRFTIAYNGEVYNFREIREELTGLGETFSTQGDTEVVLKAFRRWDAACVDRLRGMFAFGVWDRDGGRLFLARDRLGIKPLYYVSRPGSLAFASEIRTLLATGTAEPKLSVSGLAGYLRFGSSIDPDTMLDGVRSLSPGTTLEFESGQVRARRYWWIPSSCAARPADGADAVEGLRSTLQEAVALELVSDVPVGVFLSGGVDSSAVASLAAASSSRPVQTFTVTFAERAYDEAAFAAEVARQFGCQHRSVQLSGERVLAELPAAIRSFDQPSADGLNTFFVSQAARSAGLTVALSGLGGDEVFAGYPSFRTFGHLLRLGRLTSFLSGAAAERHFSPRRFPWLRTRARKALALSGAGGDPWRTYGTLKAMFTDGQLRDLVHPDYLAAVRSRVFAPEGIDPTWNGHGRIDPVNLFSALEMSHYMRNTLLRDADAMSMAHSLEVRVPLIDHVLVEWVARIPGSLKIRGARNKPVLTSAVGDLPLAAIDRPKMGFNLPMGDWLRGPLRGWMEETLSEENVRRLGVLQEAGVRRFWKMFLRNEQIVSHSRVWCLALLSRWAVENRVNVG
jgi:asparagine synthase (glutamine-hydrolysing)